MHLIAKDLISWFLTNIDQLGMFGCAALLIIGVPGELIIPPVAYVEAYRESSGYWPMTILLTVLVILCSAIGYTLSVIWVYALSRVLGRPLIQKYGRYFFFPESKLQVAERWVTRYGQAGMVSAVFVPGLRHALAIVAGVVGMRLRSFIPMAFLGGVLWSTLLATFGLVFARDMEVVVTARSVDDPVFQHALTNLTWASACLAIAVAVLYIFLVVRKPHHTDEEQGIPPHLLDGETPANP